MPSLNFNQVIKSKIEKTKPLYFKKMVHMILYECFTVAFFTHSRKVCRFMHNFLEDYSLSDANFCQNAQCN